jgi:hypothetical protein
MKRISQFVALFVAVLLSAQPGLASVSCAMGMLGGHSAHNCDRAMTEMGTDCPMARQFSGTGCGKNCSREGVPQALGQSASRAKPKAVRAQSLVLLPEVVEESGPAFTAQRTEMPVSSAPPRYILHRVFRI